MKKIFLLLTYWLGIIDPIIAQTYISHMQGIILNNTKDECIFNKSVKLKIEGEIFDIQLLDETHLHGSIKLLPPNEDSRESKAFETDKGCILAIFSDHIFLNLFKTHNYAIVYYLDNYTNDNESNMEVSDISIISEQNKVIGDIMFGMSKKESEKAIYKFMKTQEKPAPGYSSLKNIFIGEYQADYILDYYYDDKLYLFILNGIMIDFEEFHRLGPEQLKYISEVIEEKYGTPTVHNNIESTEGLLADNEYLLRSWEIGKKRIEITLEVNNSSYNINVRIFLPEIMNKIKIEEEVSKRNQDYSSKEEDKDIF